MPPKRHGIPSPETTTDPTPSLTAEPSVGPNIPSPPSTFPIVGIGASAGGLAAFEAFFPCMPADADPGMAFMMVQHLAPDHKSLPIDHFFRSLTGDQHERAIDGGEK